MKFLFSAVGIISGSGFDFSNDLLPISNIMSVWSFPSSNVRESLIKNMHQFSQNYQLCNFRSNGRFDNQSQQQN